nr:toxin-antitoxin system YwqK family antitoxin [Chryseosolibacter indicus]
MVYLLPLLLLNISYQLLGQGYTRQTFHDKERKHVKEVYQVKDTIRNILHGRYISYYLNGKVESKGQFTNNETTGIWEFFYETGNLKMRGILRQNANFGVWEYFYESGRKSMEGNINGKSRDGEWKMYYENGQVKEIGEYKTNKRVGLWKMYFEDGVLKGEIDYTDDYGTYTEYYHSGKVLSEGPRMGTRNVGHWRFYAEDGTLQSQGEYNNGKKQGEWITYYPNGEVSSRGSFAHDIPAGKWEHYFEDGSVSSAGEYEGGKKSGIWKTMSTGGIVKSETSYAAGEGEYREYYSSGKLKTTGKIVNDKREGKWEYYYEHGVREGECEYKNGKGVYYGYYPNGNLQTKGTLDGEVKTGTWEIYENDGKLSGYYRPFYDNKKLGKDIVSMAGKGTANTGSSKRRTFTHFDARFNEFRGLIIAGNPIMTFAGRLPIAFEFYMQERLGHEFEFIGIRDPFFLADSKIPSGKKFERGYAICIKQKLYNQMKAGMWYFGHEVRFTNYGHFVNEVITSTRTNIFTFGAVEQRIEYGPVFGYRIMKRNNAKGITIDTFVSGNVGYRGFDVDDQYKSYFEDIKKSKISASIHFGLNIGHVFSFR